MPPSKLLKSPEPSRKPRTLLVCPSWVRWILLSVGFFVLLIGVAWAFGALWFDFPVVALRRPLAVASDFSPRWETKTVHLSNLRAVDFFTNYWGSTLICHTFLSFDFGPESYVCISIETRMMQGQAYSPIAGLYRQFALYYVIGDERDIVRVRTNYRLEDVYLYRLIPATPERARALFLDYLQTANELYQRAQWYNELTSNCTTNVRVHIKNIGEARPWDWQLLVNGTIDKHAYDLGAIDTSLPFAELKRLSRINERARVADRDPDFSRRIRDGLPGM